MSTDDPRATMDGSSSADPTAGRDPSERPQLASRLDDDEATAVFDPTAGRDPEQLRAAAAAVARGEPLSPLPHGTTIHRSTHKPARGADLTSDEPGFSFGKLVERIVGFVKPRPARDVLGDRGENVAAKYLRNEGFKILERNFRCPTGEIDIIARDRDTLVFVEVKTRQYDDPTPEHQVNHHKRHQITKAAKFYMTRFGRPRPAARFDIVAVVWPNGQPPIIRHTTHAFEATF